MGEVSSQRRGLSFLRKLESSFSLLILEQLRFTRLRRASHFLCWCKESNQRNTFLFTYGVFAECTSRYTRRAAHFLCAI